MTLIENNFTPATRGAPDIELIILHCTDGEGSAQQVRDMFNQPGFDASAHFIIGRNGDVVEAVSPHDIAWHAGNWDVNKRSIGIELVGDFPDFVATVAQRRKLANLLSRLSNQYHLNLRRVYNYYDGRVRLTYGVAQHANVQGSDHMDIGPQFPIVELCAHARSDRNAKYGVDRAERA